MADELRQAFGVESELADGTRGIFDVYIDDKLVFSKHKEQRFPESREVVRLIHEGQP